MFKKFRRWFIIFGISFLASKLFGWIEQGKTFLVINLIFSTINDVIEIISLIPERYKIADENSSEYFSSLNRFYLANIVTVICGVFYIVSVLFVTWGATKLFKVDFFVAYQIMTFGQCLCANNNEKITKK